MLLVHGLRHMFHVQLLHAVDPSQTLNLTGDGFERTGCIELALPGIFFLPRHIVVGVISGFYHQRTENDLLVSGLLRLFDYRFGGCIFRFTFYRSE